MGISGKTGGVFRELTIVGDKISKEKIEFYNPWKEEGLDMKDIFLTSQKATNALSKMRTKACTLEELELN